ncbi:MULTISPECIES: hypothetical protein [unclassified Luteococcus]|uniref:hypothetical protein n=1 Tax=unclassified Luteococcus TaxID=2639923 RepID=UPI00313C889E
MKKFLAGMTATLLVFAAVLLGLPRLGVNPLGFTASRRNVQVIDAVTKEEQVVLLSLGIQGIISEESKAKILGVEVPGTGRAQFVQYSYAANLASTPSR